MLYRIINIEIETPVLLSFTEIKSEYWLLKKLHICVFHKTYTKHYFFLKRFNIF